MSWIKITDVKNIPVREGRSGGSVERMLLSSTWAIDSPRSTIAVLIAVAPCVTAWCPAYRCLPASWMESRSDEWQYREA